jgi:hypothetical protein
LKEAIAGLVRLYEETAQPDKAAEWKKKLGELIAASSEKKPAVEMPKK